MWERPVSNAIWVKFHWLSLRCLEWRRWSGRDNHNWTDLIGRWWMEYDCFVKTSFVPVTASHWLPAWYAKNKQSLSITFVHQRILPPSWMAEAIMIITAVTIFAKLLFKPPIYSMICCRYQKVGQSYCYIQYFKINKQASYVSIRG